MSMLSAYRLICRHGDERARLHDISRVSGDRLLAWVALTDKAELVAKAAVARVRSQALLARIALRGPRAGYRVSEAAVARLEDDQLLRQVWRSECYVSSSALKKIKNQSLLAEIAKQESQRWRAEMVLQRISDQSLLSELARAHNWTWSDEAMTRALKLMSEPACLANMARARASDQIRRRALSLIKDDEQEILTTLALQAASDVNWRAADRIVGQASLERIVQSNADARLRAHVVKRIDNQALLIELAKTSEVEAIRVAATIRVLDENELMQIAASNWKQVMIAAAGKISTELVLEELCTNHPLRESGHVPGQQNNMPGEYGNTEPFDWERYPVREAAANRLRSLREARLEIPTDVIQ